MDGFSEEVEIMRNTAYIVISCIQGTSVTIKKKRRNIVEIFIGRDRDRDLN